MKKLLIPLLILFMGCKVTFNPAKNTLFTENTLTISKLSHSMYIQIATSQDKTFQTYEPQYMMIYNKIDSLLFMAKAIPKNGNISKEVYLLENKFMQYESYHRAKGFLTTGEAVVYDDYIFGLIKPIIISNNALK